MSVHVRRKFGVVVPKQGHTEKEAALLSDAMTSQLGVQVEHYFCRKCRMWHVGRRVTGIKKTRQFIPGSELERIELGERVVYVFPLENSRKLGRAKRTNFVRNRCFLAQWRAAKQTMSAADFRVYAASQSCPVRKKNR